MADMKYTEKDSVFSFIFRQPENTRRLYMALHPEDNGVTEEDCRLVTLEHVLTNGMTNDLGFQVRDKLILLVEAQSKFSVNIALRMLLYLAATYKEYVEEQKLEPPGSCRRSCACPICTMGPEGRRWRSRSCGRAGPGALWTNISDSAQYPTNSAGSMAIR